MPARRLCRSPALLPLALRLGRMGAIETLWAVPGWEVVFVLVEVVVVVVAAAAVVVAAEAAEEAAAVAVAAAAAAAAAAAKV